MADGGGDVRVDAIHDLDVVMVMVFVIDVGTLIDVCAEILTGVVMSLEIGSVPSCYGDPIPCVRHAYDGVSGLHVPTQHCECYCGQ